MLDILALEQLFPYFDDSISAGWYQPLARQIEGCQREYCVSVAPSRVCSGHCKLCLGCQTRHSGSLFIHFLNRTGKDCKNQQFIACLVEVTDWWICMVIGKREWPSYMKEIPNKERGLPARLVLQNWILYHNTHRFQLLSPKYLLLLNGLLWPRDQQYKSFAQVFSIDKCKKTLWCQVVKGKEIMMQDCSTDKTEPGLIPVTNFQVCSSSQ